MTEKYKVTQEFMDELSEWRDDNDLNPKSGAVYAFVDGRDIKHVPNIVDDWWTDPDNPTENNHRLIAIIQWLNGEDVFEVEVPHKFVVRSENTDRDGDYNYVKVFNRIASPVHSQYATKFDTREEAQEWANSHQVIVEIDEEGNEVEQMDKNESISASISGTYVEAEKRVDGDQLLLNAIESERDERVEATREIYDKLRKHEVALNFAIGLAVGLLISMILIAWQTLN